MNQYSQLLYRIKELCESNPYVSTVTKGAFDTLDLDKGNLFPLVHINIYNAGFTTGQTITFGVQIGCFDVRDINKEVVNDKFWENDNEVDNHNLTLAILNDIWVRLYKDFEQLNITASENPTLEIVTFEHKNLLDGWILDFTVELPNTELSIC